MPGDVAVRARQQIEVLRGRPQGTTYGANALAGLINIRTADPGTQFELHGELTGGTYDTRAIGLVVGDGFDSGDAGWRVAAQQYRSDGFRHDVFYDMNTTNGYDEGTLRGKVHWQINPALQADLTLMHVDINNGYDAWSIYNTYNTYSNQPGRDAQLSNGGGPATGRSDRRPGRTAQRQQCCQFIDRVFVRRRLGQRRLVGRVRTLRLLPER